MPPADIDIEPGRVTEFLVEPETPVVVTFKFWLQRNSNWTSYGPKSVEGNAKDPWVVTPPIPSGSVFAYWLGLAGKAKAQWRVRVSVAQKNDADAWVTKGHWLEPGTLSDEGNGFGVDSTNIVKVTLK